MLHQLDTLLRLPIEASDGDIGRCRDFLFDDRDWLVRYLVVDTGKWLPGTRVLVPSPLIEEVDLLKERVPVKLTREQVRQSPPLDTHAPVSRQYEIQLADHYQTLYWWVGPGSYGGFPTPATVSAKPRSKGMDLSEPDEPHLRSYREVRGYGIQAADGSVGHLEGLLVDDDDWSLPFLVVDTRNWLPGRKVVLSRRRAAGISWHERSIRLNRTRAEVEAAPDIELDRPVDPELASLLRDRYGEAREGS